MKREKIPHKVRVITKILMQKILSKTVALRGQMKMLKRHYQKIQTKLFDKSRII